MGVWGWSVISLCAWLTDSGKHHSHLQFLLVSGTFCLQSGLQQVQHMLSLTEVRGLNQSLFSPRNSVSALAVCLASLPCCIVWKLGDCYEKKKSITVYPLWIWTPWNNLKAGSQHFNFTIIVQFQIQGAGGELQHARNMSPIKYHQTALYGNVTDIRYCMKHFASIIILFIVWKCLIRGVRNILKCKQSCQHIESRL